MINMINLKCQENENYCMLDAVSAGLHALWCLDHDSSM